MGVRTVTRVGRLLALAVTRIASKPLEATLKGSTERGATTPPRLLAHVRMVDRELGLRNGIEQMLTMLTKMKPRIIRTLKVGMLLLLRPKMDESPFTRVQSPSLFATFSATRRLTPSSSRA